MHKHNTPLVHILSHPWGFIHSDSAFFFFFYSLCFNEFTHTTHVCVCVCRHEAPALEFMAYDAPAMHICLYVFSRLKRSRCGSSLGSTFSSPSVSHSPAVRLWITHTYAATT